MPSRTVAVALVAFLTPAIALAAKPGWRTEGGAKFYYSANSFPTYRPPVVRYQSPPLLAVPNVGKGGFSFVPGVPVISGSNSQPTYSVPVGGGNWGFGGGYSYSGYGYCPPSGAVVINPYCK